MLTLATQDVNYKWQSHTSLKHSEIPWYDAECQAALVGTRQEKKAKSWD